MASTTLANGIKRQDTRATADGPAQRSYDNAGLLDAFIGSAVTNPMTADLDLGGYKFVETADKLQMEGSQSANAVGTNSLDLQVERTAATQVASGADSVSVGRRNTASGARSIALGINNTASNSDTVSIGKDTSATGTGSVALGYGVPVTGNYSVGVGASHFLINAVTSYCAGYYNTCSGAYSTVVGLGASTNATGCSAFGYFANASANYSIAIGTQCGALAINALAVGNSATASGTSSLAFGQYVNASGGKSSAIGHYAKTTIANTAELGYWSNSLTRGGAVRMHPNGQVALTIEDSATAPTDGGATAGSEADATLPRGMFSIQKNGTAVTLYYNNAGTIQSLSLGTLA